MYIALEVNDKTAQIYDTSDNTTETVDISTVISILNRGITIVGLTDTLAEAGVLGKVILRFECVNKEFNGFYFTDYSDLYEDCLAQPIYIELNDLMDINTFLFLAKYLYKNNKKYYSFKKSETEQAFVHNYFADDDTFDITCPNGETYNFNYFDILYSVFEEGYKIDKIDINQETLSLTYENNRIITFKQGVISLYNMLEQETKRVKEEIIDKEFLNLFNKSMNLDMSNIDNVFSLFPNGILTPKYGLPICNLRNRVKTGKLKDTSLNVSFDGKNLLVNNEPFDGNNRVHCYDVNAYIRKFDNPDIWKYIDSAKAKAKFFGKSFDIYNDFETDICKTDIDSFENILQRGQRIKTNFGEIQLRPSRFLPPSYFKGTDFSQSYIFLSRVTNVGTLYYSLSNYTCCLGNTKHRYEKILNPNLKSIFISDCLWENKMFPLGVTGITEDSETITIDIDFLVNKNIGVLSDNGLFNEYGYTVVTMPLIVSPVNITYDSELKKYRIDTYLDEIILDEDVYNHLEGYKTTDVRLMEDLYRITSSKSSKDLRNMRDFFDNELKYCSDKSKEKWYEDNGLVIKGFYNVDIQELEEW